MQNRPAERAGYRPSRTISRILHTDFTLAWTLFSHDESIRPWSSQPLSQGFWFSLSFLRRFRRLRRSSAQSMIISATIAGFALFLKRRRRAKIGDW